MRRPTAWGRDGPSNFVAGETDHVVAIVNALRERRFKPGAMIVEAPAGDTRWRCFVARQTNGQLVLLSVQTHGESRVMESDKGHGRRQRR